MGTVLSVAGTCVNWNENDIMGMGGYGKTVKVIRVRHTSMH